MDAVLGFLSFAFVVLMWTVVVFLIVGFYFLPSLVAFFRKKQSGLAIGFLNLLLGWTVLGWIGSLVWALTAD